MTIRLGVDRETPCGLSGPQEIMFCYFHWRSQERQDHLESPKIIWGGASNSPRPFRGLR